VDEADVASGPIASLRLPRSAPVLQLPAPASPKSQRYSRSVKGSMSGLPWVLALASNCTVQGAVQASREACSWGWIWA
jgi:hypothetical protein